MSTEEARPAEPVTVTDADDDDAKYPKKKLAIVFGYVGEKYCGLQWNHDPTHPTVEEVLLGTLNRCGLISAANMGPQVMQKLGWERASRTDKGVHALKNLISVRLMLPGDGTIASAVANINKALPTDIHVFGMTPVTRSFNAHTMCVGRRYEYYLPSFALMSKEEFAAMLPPSVAPKDPAGEFLTFEEDRDGGGEDDEGGERARKKQRADDAGGGVQQKPFIRGLSKAFHMSSFKDIPPETMAAMAAYRVPKANVDRARQLMLRYVGTLRFHNFTPAGRSNDPSTIRFIRAITIDDPVVTMPAEGQNEATKARYASGLEWVRIELDGQSFMLNQIRKMIGCVVSVMAAGLPDSFIDDCLSKDVQRGIPMAPANGLFLSYLDFTRYNLRLGRIQTEGNNGAGKDGIFMEEVNKAEERRLHEQIVAVIARREMDEDITGRWMRSARHVIFLAWGITLE
jgi:tRNA pseudouridine(38-40) synthase